MPKISVILPTYNVATYIPKCMESLLNQTLQDIEIIFVNDCSPDNSKEIIESYKDSRIKLINHDVNKYTAEARNTGIDNATGEYLAFIDPDDYIDLAMLEKLYVLAKENNADIAKGVMKFLPNNIIRSKNKAIEKDKFNFQFMLSSAIYRKKLIDDYNIRFSIDVICAQFPMIYYANKVVTCEDAIYYYIKRPNSCVNSKFSIDKWKKLNIAGVEKTLSFMNTHAFNKSSYILVIDMLLNLCHYGYDRMLQKDKKIAKPILNDYLDTFWNNVLYKDDVKLNKKYMEVRNKYA